MAMDPSVWQTVWEFYSEYRDPTLVGAASRAVDVLGGIAGAMKASDRDIIHATTMLERTYLAAELHRDPETGRLGPKPTDADIAEAVRVTLRLAVGTVMHMAERNGAGTPSEVEAEATARLMLVRSAKRPPVMLTPDGPEFTMTERQQYAVECRMNGRSDERWDPLAAERAVAASRMAGIRDDMLDRFRSSISADETRPQPKPEPEVAARIAAPPARHEAEQAPAPRRTGAAALFKGISDGLDDIARRRSDELDRRPSGGRKDSGTAGPKM